MQPAKQPDMTLWGGAKLLFLIFFITCFCAGTLAQIPMECCLSVKNQTIGKHMIMDYSHQIKGQGCPRDATILVTRRKRSICVPTDELWVKNVLKHVDWLKAECKKDNYKGRRCTGLGPKVK